MYAYFIYLINAFLKNIYNIYLITGIDGTAGLLMQLIFDAPL